MSAMPVPAAELDPKNTLAVMARGHRFGNDRCRKCRRSPYPRGFIVNLGLCWTCHYRGLTK